MVPEQVPDHEDALQVVRKVHQLRALALGETQGFFDVDVLAGLERRTHHVAVQSGRRRQGHRVDVRAGENVVVDDGLERHGILLTQGRPRLGIGVADCRQGTEIVEIPHQVLAPVPTAHYGYPWRARHSVLDRSMGLGLGPGGPRRYGAPPPAELLNVSAAQ